MINRTEISSFQLFFILFHIQVGVGVVSLPYDVFVKAKSDAWLSILLSGAIIQVLILLYGMLIRRFPEHNLYDISILLFGNVFGRVLIILYIVSYISSATIILADYASKLRTWMMPMTPNWVLIAFLCFVVVFVVKENIQVIARFATIITVVFFMGSFAIIYALKFADITFILPIGTSGLTSIIEGIEPSLFSFQGFEALLLVHPFVKATPRSIIKTASFANLFVTLLYATLVIVSILYFSPYILGGIEDPGLYIYKAFTSKVFERTDLLFTSIWIVVVTTSLMIIIYVGVLGILRLLNATNLKKYTLLFTVICFILSLSFTSEYEINYFYKIHNYIAAPLLSGIPILLLLISFIFRKRERGVK